MEMFMRAKYRLPLTVVALAVLGAVLAVPALGQDVPPPKEGERTYSPYPEVNFPNRVFFGDTHLHTSYSTDAGMLGNTLGPDEAYRFARGEEVVQSHGLRARLQRPLDFLVIADHAANLGLATMLQASDPDLLATDFGRRMSDLLKAGDGPGAYNVWLRALNSGQDPLAGSDMLRSMWLRLTAAAEEYNEPGRFTALIGYEWTSIPEGNNLHRVLVFRDDHFRTNQIIPFSQYDSVDPRTSGIGWRTTRPTPEVACLRQPTTATSPTASCSTTSH